MHPPTDLEILARLRSEAERRAQASKPESLMARLFQQRAKFFATAENTLRSSTIPVSGRLQ